MADEGSVYTERRNRMWMREVGREEGRKEDDGREGGEREREEWEGRHAKIRGMRQYPEPSQTGASHAHKGKTGRGYSF
jgi:hypothetical protein